MRRTMIIGAIGATALTIGLGVGATLAASEPIPHLPVESVSMPDGHMDDVNDMTSMMKGNGMTNMMDAGGMESMHRAMHDVLAGTIDADALAACDTAHDAMTTKTTSATGVPGHAAHHPGSQP